MKIIAIDAIDINSYGGLIHLQQLVRSLSKKNIYLKVFSNSFIKKNLKSRKKIKIIKKNVFDKNFILRHVWKIIFLRKELLRNKCQILLSLNGVYHGQFKSTILLLQNTLPFDDLAKSKYNITSKIKFFLQKIAILTSIYIHRNVIFTSHDFKNKVLKYFKNKENLKSKVIYHGVERAFKNKKRFHRKKLKLLFVSEFKEYKNHEKLFEAINRDKKNIIDLTCIGKYDKKYIQDLNFKYKFKKHKIKIIKKNSHKKIFKKYKNFDALIFPSLTEAFGLPVLEAAANRLPILCSNLKVFKEIFKNGCIYFNPYNSKSILNRIYYFSSLNKNIINKKINHNYKVSKNLSWDYFGNNYYQTIINSFKSK